MRGLQVYRADARRYAAATALEQVLSALEKNVT